MKIVVFGATGMIGSRIAAELEQRGHAVTAATRASGADVTGPQSVAGVAAGADAVVSAVSARRVSYTLADVAPVLVEGLCEADVRRLPVVGGAGSLEAAPGKRLLDAPDFPEEWKPEAIAQSEALDYYRAVEDLDWTLVSPAAFIHPGERTVATGSAAISFSSTTTATARSALRTTRSRSPICSNRAATSPNGSPSPGNPPTEGGPKWQWY